MAKIIKILLILLFAVPLQAQNTWISGGGGDTTGIVHNAIKIKGVPVTLIPPADNQILKFDAAADSFKLEADLSAASGSDSVFFSATIHDLDLDTLFFKASGFSGTNTFAAGTRVFVYKDAATELFGIDSTGAIVTGTWSGTSISDANVDDNITVTSYLLLAAILDSLNNYDGDISFTQGNTTLKVLLDSLNNYDGDIVFTQGNTTYKNFLDSLDNYNGNIIFTQGNTALNTDAVDNINELSVALWNTATLVTFASGADTVLIRDATDNSLKKAVITTGGGSADSVFISMTAFDLDADTLFFKPEGVSGTNTFVAGTYVFVYKDEQTHLAGIDSNGTLYSATGLDAIGAVDISIGSSDVTDIDFTTDGVGTAEIVLPAGAIDGTEILDATITSVDFETNAIDSVGKIGDGLWNSAPFVTYASDTVLIRDVTDGATKKTIIVASGMSAAAFDDSLNNYDGDVVFTEGNSTIADGAVQGNDISYPFSKSFVITNPVATSDYPVWRLSYAYTITDIEILVEGGTNVVLLFYFPLYIFFQNRHRALQQSCLYSEMDCR